MFKIQKGYDSESKTFRLPIELIGRMEILAARNKLSLNQLVIQCLNYAMNNLVDGDIKGEDTCKQDFCLKNEDKSVEVLRRGVE